MMSLSQSPPRTTIQRSVPETNALGVITGILLQELESKALGLLQSCFDFSVAIRRVNLQIGAVLVRPYSTSSEFQICIPIGNKYWKKKGRADVDCLRFTFRQGISYLEHRGYDISCTCADFCTRECCEHKFRLLENQEVCLRLESMSSRQIDVAHENDTGQEWSCVPLRKLPGDEVTVWLVFWRKHISASSRMSSPVVLDERPSRLLLNLSMRIRCIVCRAVSENRGVCVHESACMNFIRTIPTVERNLGSVEAMHVTDNDEERKYESKMSRSFFPCAADESALIRLLSAVIESNSSSTSGDPYSKLLLVDFYVKCPSCGFIVTDGNEAERTVRIALLHTLHHGSIEVEVADIICKNCRSEIPYDGFCDALFCLNKRHIFTRELIDGWLWEVCGTGGTFRDSFFSWDSRCVSPSSQFTLIRGPPRVNRQRGNEAFSKFLLLLELPSEEALNDLFSCRKCEVRDEHGNTRMEAVVMDGTALGILGSLPKFQRATSTVPL